MKRYHRYIDHRGAAAETAPVLYHFQIRACDPAGSPEESRLGRRTFWHFLAAGGRKSLACRGKFDYSEIKNVRA